MVDSFIDPIGSTVSDKSSGLGMTLQEKKKSDSEMLPINQARDRKLYIFCLAYQHTQS